MPFRKLLIRVMLWSLGVTALAGAMAALVGGGDMMWRIVATGLITGVAAGLLIPFAFLADKPKSRREGLLGMALIVIEFAASLAILWEIVEAIGGYRADEYVGLSMLFLGMAALPAILFLRFASMPSTRLAGHVGVWLCGVVFALLMIATWGGDRWWSNDEWFATVGALAAIGSLGMISLAGVGTQPRRWWRWAGACR